MAEKKIPQPTFLSGLGNFYFNIKYDDCYPFIFTNIKGPILVKEEDMDAYIRSHEEDFIGQAEKLTTFFNLFLYFKKLIRLTI